MLSSDPAATAETVVRFPPRKLVQGKSTDVQTVLSTCIDLGTLHDISGSLPAFDHFAPPNNFIQSTSVRKPPHRIEFEAAKMICAHCAALGLTAEFYFAVPNDTFELWKLPQPFAISDENGKKRQRSIGKLGEVDRAAVDNLRQSVLSIDLTSRIERN